MFLAKKNVFLVKSNQLCQKFEQQILFEMDKSLANRITFEAGKRSGQPCIRGLRITVFDVLSYLAADMSIEEILSDFPMLEREDILACLAFAANSERVSLVAA